MIEPTSPGEYLLDELRERGISQAAFAEMIGMPASKFSLLVNGEKRLTERRAIAIADALGTSAETWLNLESSWRLHLQRVRAEPRKTLDDWVSPPVIAAALGVTRAAVVKRIQTGFFKTAKKNDRDHWVVNREEVIKLIPRLEKKHVKTPMG